MQYTKIKWEKRLKVMRISTITILVALILLILFAGFTIYGNKVGNFVISVDRDKLNISLSEYEDLSNRTSRLVFSGLNNQGDSTLVDLPKNLSLGIGDKSDRVTNRYLAYSFYLINENDIKIDYRIELIVIDSIGDPLSILRVMLIAGDKEINNPANYIFAKEEPTEESQNNLLYNLQRYGYYETQNFINDQTLFSIIEKDLISFGHQKYTIVIWNEGWDDQCVDDRLGDRIKLQINIYAI